MGRSNATEAWTKKASELLVGKTIVSVRYMTAEELQELGWVRSTLVVELSDGTLVWPMTDEAGNDAGVLQTTNNQLPTIPRI